MSYLSDSECLAVVFGVVKFHQHLEHREFLLETDNQALRRILARPWKLWKWVVWIAKLITIKFKVSHVRGTQNVIADSISQILDLEKQHNNKVLLSRSQVKDYNQILTFPLKTLGPIKNTVAVLSPIITYLVEVVSLLANTVWTKEPHDSNTTQTYFT